MTINDQAVDARTAVPTLRCATDHAAVAGNGPCIAVSVRRSGAEVQCCILSPVAHRGARFCL